MEDSQSADYSYINVCALSRDSQSQLLLRIAKDGRLLYQSNGDIFVSAAGEFNIDAFVQKYGIVNVR